ncbi:uncharacterized protein LOC102809960, partial [Saccoglossus kowalevskii]|uniref:Ubiquitin-conjugating enzyme E2 T-like n=1 Tax=Saccoglossus kowalevskii TaxID=10224 RepID=A0ABM0MWV5_SACKO
RDLTRYSRESYDVQPQHKLPEDINKPVAPAHVILNKVTDDPPAGSKSAPPIRIKRILREISSYMSTPHQAIQIFPCENNIGFWRILLLGPADTPYENGVYSLYAEFPKDYPAVPPIVRFITPIYHCNVNASGRICHSVFDREYTSDTPITTILTCVFGLLITPEPDDPLDSTLAEEYFADKVLYDQKAGAHSRLHASKTIAEHQQEMLSSESREFEPLPSHLVCPLSKELFVDPVKTPHGHVYERYAIEAHLSKTSIDPVALKPLVEDQLVPCCDVKKLAEEYRSSRIKVDAWWQE